MNYPYANGVIKALENKIQDRNKLLVLSKYDKTEFVKVLLAMNYGGEGSTIEEIINAENKRVRNLINEITPKKEDTDLFYLVNDAQNIKVLYKIKKYAIDKYELLDNSGSLDIENLKEAIINNNYESVSKKVKQLIEQINNEVENIESPKLLSSIIDKAIYKFALNKTNNNTLKKYLQAKIDVTNVISMIRAENLKWAKDDYLDMFIEGGLIKKETFEQIYKQDNTTKAKALSEYYEEKISRILASNIGFNRIEIVFDRLLIELMELDKNEPFDIGPMIYFYLLKQAEAQNIRILYSATKVELKDLI